MKYKITGRISILLLSIALLFMLVTVSPAEETSFPDLPAWQALPVYVQEISAEGQAGSFVRYPLLVTDDDAYRLSVDIINQAIQAEANIPAYLQLLSTITEGSTGLKLDYEIGALHTFGDRLQLGNPYLSILFSAEGKMLQGRPSQVYYPMTFDLRTGETVSFDALFTDPNAAKERIEALLEKDVEPTLSTYLENSQLFPVPYDRFFLDGFGHLIIAYEQSQLSFLSGYSGSVSFRYSELVPPLGFSSSELQDYFAPTLTAPEEKRLSFARQMMRSLPVAIHRAIELGDDLSDVLARFRSTTDSGFYPGGAYYEVEDANYRGTLILTDETEQTVTGLLTSRTDLMDIHTASMALADAEAFLREAPTMEMEIDESLAEIYRVCPGTAAIYRLNAADGKPIVFTLYADADGVVQFVKLAYE